MGRKRVARSANRSFLSATPAKEYAVPPPNKRIELTRPNRDGAYQPQRD